MVHSLSSRSFRLLAVVVALSTVLTGLLVAAVPSAAHAAPADTMLPSDNPYNWTPKVLDGKVDAVKQVGNVVVVGGNFTQIQNSGNNQPILNQPNLFAYDATTGRILTTFLPTVDDAVDAVIAGSSSNTVYVAGPFGSVNGVGGRVAELNVNTGARTAFRAQGINNRVYDIRLVGQKVFVAGSFTSVQQVPESGMAVLDATTGNRIADYDVPDFTGVAWDANTFTNVKKIDVTPDGSKLIAIGNFNAVGGQTRTQIAMLDLGATSATVNGWMTDRFRAVNTPGTSWCSASFDTYLHDVDFSGDGSFFIVGTTGAYRAGRLCDTVTRWETNRTGNQTETWADYTGGDTTWAVEVAGPVVYIGGHMRWVNNSYRGDNAGPGAVPRQGMAALDARNGLPFSWDPTRKRGVGLFDFDVTNSQIWAGSDTTTWAGEIRPRLAGFPFDGDSTTLPNDTTASLPADLVSLGTTAAPTSQTVRNFNGTSIVGSGTQTAPESWSLARGAVMIDGTVYMGWADSSTLGTLRARTYNGTSFGPMRNVDLFNNGYTTSNTTYTLFANEIPRLTGMFFDRASGRLYYTVRPQGTSGGGFFYRYFTPESGVVGAQRFTAVGGSLIGANASGSTTPQSMFLSGGNVYYSDQTGVMKRIAFTPGVDGAAGGVTGAATVVNNAVDWRSNAMFASTAPTTVGPNQSPTAALDVTCKGLDCTVDATDSSDPDGSIASYAFDFGDGNTVPAGPNGTVEHTYASAGTYSVSVTVTDNRGAPASTSQSVSPAPVTSPITFRTSGKYTGGNQATHNWTIPNGVVAGDRMVLAVSGATAQTLTTPAGWTVLDQQLDQDVRTVILTKVASGTDAGSAIRFAWSGATRTSAVLAAYNGVGGAPTVTGATEAGTPAAHTAPSVTMPADGSWALSYFADKNAATTSWSAPAGQVVRETAVDPALVGTSTTRVTGFLTEDAKPSLAGNRGGTTATANATAGKATMFTIVLSPAGPNQSPTAALDVSCSGLVCTADASDSSDPDGSIVSYAFDYGDGNTRAAGPSATAQHEYATGSYDVTVTVTDNRGGSDTETVHISPAPLTSPIQFRVSAKYTGGPVSTHNWNIPNGVVEGDQMVLAVTGSTNQTLTTPAGWTVVDQVIDTDMRTYILSRVATASDPGAAVSLVWSGGTRTVAVLAAYSGTSGAVQSVASVEGTSRAAHTAPNVTVPVDGAWVLSYWADKNAATTDWTAPNQQNEREVVVDPALVGTGTTRVSGLFTDDVEPSAAGSHAGLTATADAVSGKATMFTIVLRPAP